MRQQTRIRQTSVAWVAACVVCGLPHELSGGTRPSSGTESHSRAAVRAAFEPVRTKSHVQRLRSNGQTYVIDVNGTVDMGNTTTRRYESFEIAFQNNVSLTIANTGDATVSNPRVITNGKRRWWCLDEMLHEILGDAEDDQEKALLIYDFVRKNRHHDDPIFGDNELHDPVKMLNVFGAGLCDDSGYVGCSLLYHAGLNERQFGDNPVVRTLHGHMTCEAILAGGYQFLDIDQNTFYLDLENERPVSGDAVVRDHYLAKRELAYGPLFKGWTVGERAASLFGRDDGATFRAEAGHRIDFDLRPGERIEYRWDQCGKFASDDSRGRQNRRFWGNSRWVYQPVLTPSRIARDATEHTPNHLVYQMKTPYALCGGRVHARLHANETVDRFAISISRDGESWDEVWSSPSERGTACQVEIDDALQYKRGPAKYAYFVKVLAPREAIASLRMETDLMTSPHSLPRLSIGRNHVEYMDETAAPHEVTITHRWRESDTVNAPIPPTHPTTPRDGQTVHATTVPFSWPADAETTCYHIQVSRSKDMRIPYRPSFDVIIQTNEHHAPFAGLFNPGQPYYWRVRPRNREGVWGAWSPVWEFQWKGPRIPVGLEYEIHDGEVTLAWHPNPHGPRPAHYEVYGSDQRGFTPSKTRHEVEGLGTRPGNVLGTTTQTHWPAVSSDVARRAANHAFYRVVAVDRDGVASGPSEQLELPHPFIYSRPVTHTVVGSAYHYQARTIRCLGDLQFRYAPPNRAFWEREEYEFELADGPDWLTINKKTGVLSGISDQDDVGVHPIAIVCHRRYPHELQRDDARSSYFLKDGPRFQAEHRQVFQLSIQ